MIDWRRALTTSAIIVCALALAIIAYKMTSGLGIVVKDGVRSVDYINFVVILLTVVTVIFAIGSLVLGVLGVFGFETLKREASSFAAKNALENIEAAFRENGSAYLKIRQEIESEDGHLKRWMKIEIERSVLELRALRQLEELSTDPSAPTDEGEVD